MIGFTSGEGLGEAMEKKEKLPREEKEVPNVSEKLEASGLASTSEKIRSKRTSSYNPLELAILRMEGIQPQGIWFAKEGSTRGVTRDAVESTLKDSVYTAIIKRVDAVDEKLNSMSKVLNKMKELAEQQLEIQRRILDGLVIADAEKQREKVDVVPGVERAPTKADSFFKDFYTLMAPLLLALISRFREQWADVTAGIRGFTNYIGRALGEIKNSVGRAVEFITSKMGALWDDISKAAKNLGERIKTIASEASSWVKEKLGIIEPPKITGVAVEEGMTKGAAVAAEDLLDKSGKPLRGAALEARKAKLARAAEQVSAAAPAVEEVAKEASFMEKLKQAGKVAVKGAAIKITEKAASLLGFLNMLKSAALGPLKILASPIMYFVNPMITAVMASLSPNGKPSWTDVKHEFVKSVGAMIGGESGAVFGAFLGSVVPGFGTIIGAVAGGVAGAELGEYIAEQFWSVLVEGKSVADVLSEIGTKSLEKIRNVGQAIAHPVETYEKVSESVSNAFDWLTGKEKDTEGVSGERGAPMSGTKAENFKKVMLAAKSAGDKFPEVTAAQWALESAWGQSPSGKNNFFGQKAARGEDATNLMTREVVNGQSVQMRQPFKNYASLEEGIADHVKKWSGKYSGATTAQEAVSIIVRSGYATDPSYGSKLMSIINPNSELIAEVKGEQPEKQVAASTEIKPSVASATPPASPAAPPAATQPTTAPVAASEQAPTLPPVVIASNKMPQVAPAQYETPSPVHPYSLEDEYAVYFNIENKMGVPSFA